MHVIVVGCSRVGRELVPTLEHLGHHVTVIDKDPRGFERLVDFRGTTVLGHGFDRETLIEAGIESAGALAAVTSGDNSNILIARVAREEFGIERVIARIQDPARAELYERLGITTVATVAWATDQIMRRLVPGALQIDWSDPTGNVVVVERELPAHLIGTRVAELEQSAPMRVIAVHRFGAAEVATPDLIGQEGDRLHIAVAHAAINTLEDILSGGAR